MTTTCLEHDGRVAQTETGKEVNAALLFHLAGSADVLVFLVCLCAAAALSSGTVGDSDCVPIQTPGTYFQIELEKRPRCLITATIFRTR